MSPAEPDSVYGCTVSGSLRLSFDHFPGGWGWRAWETFKDNGWQPLPTPAPENTCRRFRTREQAEEFFRLLAELVFETATLPGL